MHILAGGQHAVQSTAQEALQKLAQDMHILAGWFHELVCWVCCPLALRLCVGSLLCLIRPHEMIPLDARVRAVHWWLLAVGHAPSISMKATRMLSGVGTAESMGISSQVCPPCHEVTFPHVTWFPRYTISRIPEEGRKVKITSQDQPQGLMRNTSTCHFAAVRPCGLAALCWLRPSPPFSFPSVLVSASFVTEVVKNRCFVSLGRWMRQTLMKRVTEYIIHIYVAKRGHPWHYITCP
jgi:hypothetical protein